MGAVFRNDGWRMSFVPTAKIACGSVVYINGLVGVATRTIEANTYGEIQLSGEYDVDVSGVTANAGTLVTVAAVTPAGTSTTCKFGVATTAIISTDTIARLRLDPNCNFPIYEIPESNGGGGEGGGGEGGGGEGGGGEGGGEGGGGGT